MRPANERRRYNVTSSLIGWAHKQNDPWPGSATGLWTVRRQASDRTNNDLLAIGHVESYHINEIWIITPKFSFENASENVVCKMWTILFRSQRVDAPLLWFHTNHQVPVPFKTIFRSNSKFDQNLQYSGWKCTLPNTTKFCTRHDSNCRDVYKISLRSVKCVLN